MLSAVFQRTAAQILIPCAALGALVFSDVLAPPTINIWYGTSQTFATVGIPQQWANILGDVSDCCGISSLTYTLNGGTPRPLSIGANKARLVDAGDFNAEIDFAELDPGVNHVRIEAVDHLHHKSTKDVSVSYVPGKVWPTRYKVDASEGANIQNLVQVIDGKWVIQPDGTLRPKDFGYDRLFAIGDRNWVNYEVLARISVNSVDPHDFGFGIIAGWQGHTADDNGVMLRDQPRTGHPFPIFASYSRLAPHAPALALYTNTLKHPEVELVTDSSGRRLKPRLAYQFRLRVSNNQPGRAHYSFKVWRLGSPEPETWDLEADGEPCRGSVMICAHRADINVGPIEVHPLPDPGTRAGTSARSSLSIAASTGPSANTGPTGSAGK